MDLKMRETGNGGDLIFEGGDIKLTSEIYNQPYLARFGGNKEASSTDQFMPGEERGDWWGNMLLSDNPKEQLNSKFEKALNEIPLSSSGRIKLERIAGDDLDYLEGFAESESSAKITGVDRLRIVDKISQSNNNSFSYIWDEAKDEILE